MRQEPAGASLKSRLPFTLAMPAFAAGLAWAYGPVLREMAETWAHDPRYSHGYLVPAFALFLLWHRRDLRPASVPEASSARVAWGGGLALIAAGAVLRLLGARYFVGWLVSVSILPSLGGVALLLGGWAAFRWTWPAIAFLFFMIPLPYRVEMALGYPLQRIATLASNYSLQTLGLPAVAEGNVILLDDVRIGVVEACNGLGMLFMFFAFAAAVVLLVQRSAAEKVVIILSAIPIAVAANVARIVLTGLLHETIGKRVADAVYHDLAGWLMMPMALGVFGLELLLLSRLFVEVAAEPIATIRLGMGSASGRLR